MNQEIQTISELLHRLKTYQKERSNLYGFHHVTHISTNLFGNLEAPNLYNGVIFTSHKVEGKEKIKDSSYLIGVWKQYYKLKNCDDSNFGFLVFNDHEIVVKYFLENGINHTFIIPIEKGYQQYQLYVIRLNKICSTCLEVKTTDYFKSNQGFLNYCPGCKRLICSGCRFYNVNNRKILCGQCNNFVWDCSNQIGNETNNQVSNEVRKDLIPYILVYGRYSFKEGEECILSQIGKIAKRVKNQANEQNILYHFYDFAKFTYFCSFSTFPQFIRTKIGEIIDDSKLILFTYRKENKGKPLPRSFKDENDPKEKEKLLSKFQTHKHGLCIWLERVDDNHFRLKEIQIYHHNQLRILISQETMGSLTF